MEFNNVAIRLSRAENDNMREDELLDRNGIYMYIDKCDINRISDEHSSNRFMDSGLAVANGPIEICPPYTCTNMYPHA